MNPTVKRMVLFKHGVAYVERGGPAEGSFSLSFAKSEMNDVLKSLAVWVERGEARPTTVAFEKPESPELALDEKGLNLPADKSLSALLTAMRGRAATILVDGPKGERELRGEVVGLDERPEGQGVRSALVLATGGGAIESVDVERVRRVALLDPVAQSDLDFLLERRRAATSHERRSVHVGVEGRAEDLRVAYVVPAPVWRVSYRVIRDASGDDEKTVVAAWAIVHNPLDEDAKDVALTLTTGQPISFSIDLYHPKLVERVVVEESSRALSAPPEHFERAMPMMASAGFGGAPPAPAAAPAPRAKAGRAMIAAAEQAADGAVQLGERGELFEYHVDRPVTLARGGSALVPLLTRTVPARRERLWREGRAGSPDLVLRFPNSTGAVLEEGPAVIYDEGVYAGEAMVPYSARGAEVRFAYAKDLSVRCSLASRGESVVLGVRFGESFALEDQRIERRITLRAESDHDEPVDVIFELPRRADLDPRSPRPIEETAHTRRFLVKAPPHGFAELELVETSPTARRVELRGLSPSQLEAWRRLSLLEPAVDALLGEAARAAAAVTLHEQRAAAHVHARGEALKGQDGITKQLQVLREGGAEGELRLRYVDELRAAQDRINALERAAEDERQKAAAAAQEIEQILRRIGHP